jgi:hypothetical protein
MSYCPNLWISNYTYNAIYARLMSQTAEDMAAIDAPRVWIDGDLLGVYGQIAPDTDTAAMLLQRLSSVVSIPALVPGDYSIRLLDGGGGTLADYAFTPEPTDNSPDLGFSQVVTFTPGTAQVAIVETATEHVLISQTLSPNPPTVTNVSLANAPVPVTGTVSLAWDASDPDGDELSFDVAYSPDGGTNFQIVQVGVSSTTVEIDTAKLGGSSNAIFRVSASDGVNTANGDSDPFTMAAKPPEPRILLPADGTEIQYGQLINFMGEAIDWQDEAVTGDDLVWSNQYGQLGTGTLISSDDLPVGVNYITLAATNSAGLSAQDTITVIVNDDLDLPGPALYVAPPQVTWHLAPETTTPQTAELSIHNAGDGSLNWEASEAAPWLTIGAYSGTVPFTLTLTADPSDLQEGEVLTTTLWITSPASADHLTETVAVPVRMSMGDVWSPPSYFIYLPLILRDYP